MRNPRPDPRHASARRWAALVFTLALLCAQSIGLLHGVAHGVGQGVGHGVHGAPTARHAPDAHHAHDAHGAHGAHGAHDALFGDHEADDATCRLVDQLAHADGLIAMAAPAAVAATAAQAPRARAGSGPQGAARRAFQARAPPPAAA